MSTVDLKDMVQRNLTHIEVGKREYQDRAVTSVEKLEFTLDRIVVTLGQLSERIDQLETAAALRTAAFVADGPVTKGFLQVELCQLRQQIDAGFEDVVTEKVENALRDYDFCPDVETALEMIGLDEKVRAAVDDIDFEQRFVNTLDQVDWGDNVAKALTEFPASLVLRDQFDEWAKAYFKFKSFRIIEEE